MLVAAMPQNTLKTAATTNCSVKSASLFCGHVFHNLQGFMLSATITLPQLLTYHLLNSEVLSCLSLHHIVLCLSVCHCD